MPSSCLRSPHWFQVIDGIQVIAAGTSAGLLAPYVMGSVIENAATPLDGFNTGFIICGVVMLIGGAVGMALIRPEQRSSALSQSNRVT